MHHFEDAKALVASAQNMLREIKSNYDKSLHSKEISRELLVRIKNLMENLRSALDFSAHGLFEKYGAAAGSTPNIYFPYAWNGLSIADFRTKQLVEKKIPGITASRPDIVALIESFQWFSSVDYLWLPKFMDLNNENKHQRLTPQTRTSTKQLQISSGGTSMTLGEGGSITMGPGCSIQMGGLVIPGGQHISPSRPAVIFGQGSQQVIEWVSFRWQDIDEEVLPFLHTATNGVTKIVNELAKA